VIINLLIVILELGFRVPPYGGIS